jgi:hypothetical protein
MIEEVGIWLPNKYVGGVPNGYFVVIKKSSYKNS